MNQESNQAESFLSWQGQVTGPHTLREIQNLLKLGKIHSLYKIQVEGEWNLLRDYLADVEQKARDSARKQAAQTAVSALPQPPMSTPGPVTTDPIILEEEVSQYATSSHINRETLKSMLGLFGSILLFIGVFCPIISIPIAGNINYFQNGRADGTIILILACASFILCLLRKFRILWLPGSISIGLLIYFYVNYTYAITQAKESIESELNDNPFAGMATLAIQSVQLQWGFAILGLGAICVIATSVLGDE